MTIAPYESFLGTARTMTCPRATGSIDVRLEGMVIYTGFVEPSTPERGRVFEMVTERMRVTR